MPFNEKFQKWQGVILSTSIILNVFLIGFLVARIGGPSDPRAPRVPVQMELRTLPPGISFEVREEIENEMHQHQEEVAEAYERLKEVQEEINQITSEQEFDRDELEEAFAEMAGLENTIRSRMRDAYANAMRDMARESRRAIIDQRREQGRNQNPNRVDGSRWQFSIDEGRFEFNLEGLEDLEEAYGLEGLKDLEGLEIIISRDMDENGRDAMRYIFVDKDGVVNEEDLEFIEEDVIVKEAEEEVDE